MVRDVVASLDLSVYTLLPSYQFKKVQTLVVICIANELSLPLCLSLSWSTQILMNAIS